MIPTRRLQITLRKSRENIFKSNSYVSLDFVNPLTTNPPHHIETSQLIYNANQGGRLSHPILIIAFVNFRREGHRETSSEVRIQCLNPLDHSPLHVPPKIELYIKGTNCFIIIVNIFNLQIFIYY